MLFYAHNNIKFPNIMQHIHNKKIKSALTGLTIGPLQNDTRAGPLIAPH